jgi:hypothetical protein
MRNVTRLRILVLCLAVQVFISHHWAGAMSAKKSNRATDPTLGSCTLTCILPGKTFAPLASECLDNMTDEHCMRIGHEEMAVRCKSPAIQRLEARFSEKSCSEVIRK